MAVLEAAALLNTLVSGIVLGSMYALLAMGLSLIYSTVRVLNFAHGAFFMIGGFVAWTLTTPRVASSQATQQGLTGLTLPFGVGLAAAVGVILLMGLGTQKALVGPLLRRPGWVFTTLVTTLSLATILEGLAEYLFGGGYRAPPDPLQGVFSISGVNIAYAEILQFVIAVGVLAFIQVFLKRTRYGLAMRAVAQDREAANLCRINTGQVHLYAFGLGSMLAAVAGVLLSNLLFVSPIVGLTALNFAFIIIVFGGIGSVTGTLVAAFIFSFVQAYLSLILDPTWALTAAFAMMILVLAFRPQGLFGFKE
jgi:branched-chain amino acid transport system permease protein